MSQSLVYLDRFQIKEQLSQDVTAFSIFFSNLHQRMTCLFHYLIMSNFKNYLDLVHIELLKFNLYNLFIYGYFMVLDLKKGYCMNTYLVLEAA